MNHERPQLTSEHLPGQHILHAIGQQAIVRPEDRVYAQDRQSTLRVVSGERPTLLLPETTEDDAALSQEQYAEFDDTAEGRRVSDLWHHLQTLEAGIRLHRNYVVPVPSEGPARPDSIGALGDLGRLREWAQAQQLDLDFDVLEADDVSSDELDTALARVNEAQETVLRLRDGLIKHPEIRLTSPVTVLRTGRNGQPDYLEADWRVADVRGDGRIAVVSEAQKLRKFATIDQLVSWQPDVR